MTLSSKATEIVVGETLTVTAVLTNRGCGNLGLSQYRLYTD
jgi:hypothetical protein